MRGVVRRSGQPPNMVGIWIFQKQPGYLLAGGWASRPTKPRRTQPPYKVSARRLSQAPYKVSARRLSQAPYKAQDEQVSQ
jgi:hypothetical protein